jgi:membrane protein implicated in regulation of membrane protease activity
MIDNHLLLYSGVLLLFILAALIIGIIMLVVLTAVAITVAIRSRRRTESRPSAREQRWFWRQGSESRRLDNSAGPAHVSGSYPHCLRMMTCTPGAGVTMPRAPRAGGTTKD